MNPNGQWAWIECETGLGIAAAPADALTLPHAPASITQNLSAGGSSDDPTASQ